MNHDDTFSHSNLLKYIKRDCFTYEKHPDGDLYIYGYLSDAKINWDSVNVNLRGLIATASGKIIARSFKKFFTFRSYLSPNVVLLNERQIVQLPESKFKVYEKLDGSIAMLYWIDDQPFLASQRSFKSKKAQRATQILHRKYSHTFNSLDKNKTYLFEVIYPETKVIVDYRNIEELYLIGIIDTETGEDLPLENIGFPLPHDFTPEFQYVSDLKALQNLNIPNKEGLVLVYENGLRIKIKFQWYVTAHNSLSRIRALHLETYKEIRRLKAYLNHSENKLTNKKVLSLLHEGVSIESITKSIPPAHYYSGVEQWLADIHGIYILKNEELVNSNNRILEFTNYIMSMKEEVFAPFNISIKYEDSVMWNFISRIEETFD